MAVSRFEDLIAWQKARVLAADVCRVTRVGAVAKDFGFASQLQRAAVSVMSNIAEGFERGTPKEFHRSLLTSKGSVGEVRSLLFLARDVDYVTREQFERLFARAGEVARIIGGLRAAAQRRVIAASRTRRATVS